MTTPTSVDDWFELFARRGGEEYGDSEEDEGRHV